MNRILTIIILMICSMSIAAQSQVYKLHPVVGDTLDNYEIDKYLLFTDYASDSIDYLILYTNNDLFNLVGISDSRSVLNIQISEDEVLSQKKCVEKLNNYYVSILEKDSVYLNESKKMILTSDSLNINLNFMTPEFIKSIKKDNRRVFWEEKRKEIKRNQKKGMLF